MKLDGEKWQVAVDPVRFVLFPTSAFAKKRNKQKSVEKYFARN